GLTLKITPQINEGDAILLTIDQTVSSVSDSTQAVDLITNNRSITTSVIVDDGATLVLGGLIRDEMREKEQRVPFLGSIPLLGALFRGKEATLVKTNLMVFIKPTILRDSSQAALATNEKYTLIRDLQIQAQGEESFDLGQRPALPEMESTRIISTIDLRNSNASATSAKEP
ncbi:MAG: type II secretion system protein GspD, partial [Chromatiales bacterium]|nr:type II secretion system protein GspD [Chromatiales bacterium]